jgi:hypothetical protein
MAKTIAEFIVEALKNAGVKQVYGLPGDSLNGSPMPCAKMAPSRGLTFAIKKPPPSLLEPRRILRDRSQSARRVAVRAICTLSTVSSTVTVAAFRCSRSSASS